MTFFCGLTRVTVLHEYVGCRTYEVLPSASVRDIKELIYIDTDFPVAEQQLYHNRKELFDWTRIGDLHSQHPNIFINLQSTGLKGGGRFGQTTPPLVDFLKDILRRYPEGGQILKELIQNAEDAGATEVKFLYDETQYGTESLWSADMVPYQGPALYVYNNAIFTPEDWHGIQEIARSRKKDDPLKVGRFGIGFNSVYHITDVPSIFSGDQIGILDPHQTLFGRHESGQCWNLKEDIKEINELVDQFAPFIGIFGSTKETFVDGHFPGTFFRFPLRHEPSLLSSNVYNKQKVLELFDSFRADADTVLLFLKSVQNVSLHVRESDGTERLLFRVTANENKALKHERPNSIKILGSAIDDYCNGIPSNSITCVTYHINILLEDESIKEVQHTSWLVCNSVGGRGMCNELDCLADDLKFIPTIGIAMPLSCDGQDKGAFAEFYGRAFCFLPLPPGDESKTGLPVHISGFFGLTDNRRSIKWRELDQWRDPAALWNELLVKSVVPKSYATLILEAIKRMETEENPNFPLSAEKIYNIWPDMNKTRVHWKSALEPLLSDLLQNAIVYSMGGSWLNVHEVCFSEIDEKLEYTETVLKYLQSSGTHVAKVTANISDAIQFSVSNTKPVKTVTPSLVRQVLRKSGHRGSAEEKLHLLEFVLSDGNYNELIGLELLPLQNGTFTTFSSSVSDKDVVYITLEDFPRSFFPGLEGRFLSENLINRILTTLKEASKCRGRPCTQLQLLNPERFARLIKEVANTVWPSKDMVVQWYPGCKDKKHPTIDWLKMVWKTIYIHFADDLTLFDDLPLIPKTMLEEEKTLVELVRLRTPSPIILNDESEMQLPELLPDIIENLGGIVINNLDPSLQHPLLKKYIHPPSPNSVLQLMDRMSLQKLSSQVAALPPTHKDALRRFLSTLTDVGEKEKTTIQELLIFRRYATSDEMRTSFLVLRGCKVLHHTAKLPPELRLSIPLIDSRDEATIRLANMLKVEQLMSTDCLQLMFQDIEKRFYSSVETTQLMCCYCDIKVDDLNDLLEDSVEPIILVHEDIPMKTAEWLNVPCLSTRLINPENMGFEQSGQREPLTVRIKNILEEYPSVSDIFKELLQNADDASANECNFLIDMRKNMDIRENLLDPGMAACHGPALWSFNNSEFTDSDFLNITRLGESIKRSEVDKVGKFGLGFNSVYHITDIPIIMSREFMIMFDPNINHISKHIRDKSNPGIKINWSKQQKRLRKFPNQFKPFIDVFQCQLPLTVESPYSYKGTLFRLSFRTQQEAKLSEVSNIHYNTADIYSLVDEFSMCGHRLILFTQNVNSMVLKYLKPEETNPTLAQDAVTIKKKLCVSKVLTSPQSILKEAAKLMKNCSNSKRLPTETPKSSCILQIVVEEFHHVFRRIADLHSPLFRGPEDDPATIFEMAKSGQNKRATDELPQKTVDATTWLLCACMDTGEALRFSLSESGKRLGLVPCGSVGIMLSETEDGKWVVKPNCGTIGEVFCYLPLRIKTGLPLHINGCFAVTSNRKEIWKTDTKGRWNAIFMRHVIVRAYLEALYVLRDMSINNELFDYNYYAVWPDPDNVHDDFSVICKGIYEDIAKVKSKERLKVFSDGSSWVSMKNVRFLDDMLLQRQHIGPAAFKIFQKYLKVIGLKNLCAVELPSWVKSGFEEAGCKDILLENTFSENQFFTEVFFPHVEEIEAELRDPLILYVLNERMEEFSELLQVTPCIPCSLNEHPLVTPSRLIHPEGRVSKLYCSKDGRFPFGTYQNYLNPVILIKLTQLGMVKDDILWEDLVERMESISCINDTDHFAACQRSNVILSLIDEKLKCRDPRAKEYSGKCHNIKFLPFVTKPAGFSLHWKGSDYKMETMFSPAELYVAEHQDVVCLLNTILNESSPSFKGCGSISLAVKDFLGLIRKPPISLVINQVKEVSKYCDDITLYQENITNACYKFLHEAMLQSDANKAEIMSELTNCSFILVENTYVDPAKASFHLNFDAAPYIYPLPNKYKNNFRELFECVGVKLAFSVDDFALVLESIKEDSVNKQLSENNFQLCRRIISEGIWGLIREKSQEFCESKYGDILLPDTNLAMLPAKTLCYNDCPWIKVKDTTVKYCHADIPREVAVKLGAIPKRHKALERYASNIHFTTLGTEFGQKEKLTSRIKSILNAYPSEKEMLKELLQNADDAKATEICFVFDPRYHPVDRIFDEKWAPLQGPALCVYNNQPFTEDDIRGIQNLGRGTKEANPCKTGQYGIGFNSVYHITDCPSFISCNDILCIFDPHARYAPGATTVSPGRMFKDLDADFKTQFSDVLDLYLGKYFKLGKTTMFRFPLRNSEMAKQSEISSVPASDRMVQNLLDKLRTDGAELLMFLNHMEKISICEIEKTTGVLNVLYSVRAKITDGDRLKRKQFHASVIESVTKKRILKDIPVQQITYTMDIEDSEGNLTTWLICNRSGFSNMEKVSKSVVSAHKNKDITLFPRGGVAACITHNYKKPHRAFCFLPLTLETGLPFHVNGHFALDSARRNLWRDDDGVGVRSDWNNNLMIALIAPAYVELLAQIRKRYFPGSDPTVTVLHNTPIHVVKDTLKKYLSFFPVNRLDLQPDWYCLVKAIYSCIHEDMKRLLPVVRAPNIDGSELQSAIIITWVNTSTTTKGRPFFDNLLQDELQHLKNVEYNITTRKTVAENVYRLKHLLLEVGFNLVYYCDETANLYHCLVDSGIPVSYTSPADVRTFLMTFSSADTSCNIGKLPCRLQQTNLKLFHSLKLLVDYCFKDVEESEIQIEGLPLLITLDSVLQVFDPKKPKFLTTYHELVPSRKDLFMNTLFLRYNNILLASGVAKVFDVTSFADLLSAVLPREYKSKTCVRWKENFASESWLKSAWHFVSESVNVKEDHAEEALTFDMVIDILKDWALLPGTKFTVSSNQLIVPECDVLLPLSLMHISIFPNAQSDKVFHTLMKTGCIQLALNKICSKDNILMPMLAGHTANIENPSSILKAIQHMIQTSTFRTEKLAASDFEALLMYFNCHLNNLMSQDDLTVLKSLPCFKAISGRYISISKFSACYVLTKSIPSVEVEKWSVSSSSAFLEEKINLKDLYNALGCLPIDDLEIYSKHLLPKFESLSYSAKLEHLIYLKNSLSNADESSSIKEQLFEKLEGLPIIYDVDKRLKPARQFYDRTVKVFEVMLPGKLFVPQDFFKSLEQSAKPKNQAAFLASWVTFLRNIGLKHVLSQHQILQFAKEISMKANTEKWSGEKLHSTIDVLLYHIFQERTDLLSGNFLRELSTVPFLCSERAPSDLVRFHPQYQEVNGTLPLIRFSGAQVNPKFKHTDVLQLLWTSCPILPEKATPLTIKEQEGSALGAQEQLEQVLSMLNVNVEPSLDKVLTNCRNVCSVTTLDDDMVKTRVKVLRSIYEFLNTEKREFRFQLRGVAFVMVEDGWKLLKPEEVVINLEYESDFKPYLYKLPLELGTFHQLFKLLGTEDVVATKQYVEVLSRIFKSSDGKQLDPNEMRTVKRVVSGLFKSLQNESVKVRNDLDNVRDLALYLPSQDGRLVKSSILVFDDAPHYKSRIQGNIGVQMLVDLSQCYLGKDHGFHTKLIMLLPQKLRPRLLSSILEEQLDEESPRTCQFGALCSLQGRLQLLLSSDQFLTGLVRIMKHENDNAFLANEEKAVRLCKALREGLKVSCFERLQTTLRVKGFNPIPYSRSETLAFLKRYGHAVILLYIQHSDSKDINFLLALAMTLKSATDNLISDTSYLIAMLGCNDIYRISDKLDSLGVKYDSSVEPSKLELPMAGTPIPSEIHYTLLMDPMNVFYPGEYVGYLLDAEGGDIYGSYQPTYTYAIIVQEVEKEEEENSSFLGKFYQIDIGYSEYKIVSSLDLYKFSRPDESTQSKDSAPSTPTSPTDYPIPGPRTVPPSFPGKESQKTTSAKHHSPKKIKKSSLPEILKEVTSVMEQAWRLPESERKKIIRRLYLKWHPDKNADNLEIANEVFKHLQNEINRLEKQAFLDQNVDRTSRRTFPTSSARYQSDKFSFQRFYSSWNQEATSHKSERQQYKEAYPSTGSPHSDRFFVPPTFRSVGNPVEARRWLRQARANFSAARNDLHKNANEWVCFKCYLSTKLALIAADYSVRGKSDKDVKPTALAQKIEEYGQQLEGLANDVHTLEAYGVDSLKTRYPDMLPFPQIPNDRFTSEVAMRVMECTACIIIKLENFIQSKV
ncbi:hypothetical protein NDU88_002112 [Pleurodeles waltl]|uniref:Sacsin n=1 Tax=Pleurodeles waltl TaxID=8319 RepID=A0AAV7NCS8_PLEWA|nr:hypothetical protein NDU88_002112 [Pleurodeles waltl]